DLLARVSQGRGQARRISGIRHGPASSAGRFVAPTRQDRGSGPMKTWKKYCAGLALSAGLTPAAWAQIPAAPPGAAVGVGGPAAVVGVGAAPAPAPATLFTFLGLSKDQLAGCKAKLCATPLGQLLANMMKPVSAMSGGLIGNCCPPLITADLAKPADSAEGAAARIEADEAGAAARKAA